MNQKSPWKIKSSQVVYANPWIKVNEHQVINPAGNDGIYTVVEFQNIAIAILPIDQDGYTYLVGQYRFSLNSYEWEIPEGGCPLGTEPLATAQRELQEECGLLAQHYECILHMQLSNSVSNEISYSYIATQLTHTNAEPEETEQLQIKKLHFRDLYQMVMEGEIKDALSVATILKTAMLYPAYLK